MAQAAALSSASLHRPSASVDSRVGVEAVKANPTNLSSPELEPVEEATEALMELDEPSISVVSSPATGRPRGASIHMNSTNDQEADRSQGDTISKLKSATHEYPAQLEVSSLSEVNLRKPHIEQITSHNATNTTTDRNMNDTRPAVVRLKSSQHGQQPPSSSGSAVVAHPDVTASQDHTLTARDNQENVSSLTLDFESVNLNSQQTSTPIGVRTVSARVEEVSPCTAPSGREGGSCVLEESTSSRSTTALLNQSSESTGDHEIDAPIVGYEVMEQRARFTVFKIHVCKSAHERWFIFRRYTDFHMLNDKLRELFPFFRLALPPKKYFGDNFEEKFLKERIMRLQAFINNVIGHRDACQSRPVRDFFCFDDPPGPHDSLEESRALCEALEEQIYTLRQELQERDAKIGLLEAEVSVQKLEIDNLRKSLKIERALNSMRKNSPTSQSDNSIIEQDESSCTEADQAQVRMQVKGQKSEEKPDSVSKEMDVRLEREVQRIEDRICSLVEKETAPLLEVDTEEGATAW